MLSDERKNKLRTVAYKIHDSMAEAMTDANLSAEERQLVLCAVVSDIQGEIIEYLKQNLD